VKYLRLRVGDDPAALAPAQRTLARSAMRANVPGCSDADIILFTSRKVCKPAGCSTEFPDGD